MTPAEPRTNTAAVRLTIVALAAVLVLPLMAQKVLGGNRQSLAVVGSTATLRQVDLMQGVLGLVTVTVCLFLAMRYRPDSFARPPVSMLTAFVAPWVALSTTNLAHGLLPATTSFGYLLVVVALWRAAAPVHALAVLGVLGGLVAACSVALGLFWPQLGLYANAAGVSVDAANKGVFVDRLLSGVFLSTNNLGQFLVLALPFAFLISWTWLRVACVLVSGWATVWSGSRSSLAATVAVLLVLAVLRTAGDRERRRRATASCLLLMAGSACLAIPVVAERYPSSFSGRGRIWRLTLDAWYREPWLGLGSDWFLKEAGMRTELGPRSVYTLFHAHNQFVHVLATGGVFVGAVTLAMLVVVCRTAARLPGREGAVAVAYLVSFFVSGALELNLGIVDRWQFWVTALAPLVIIAASGQGRPQVAGAASDDPGVIDYAGSVAS